MQKKLNTYCLHGLNDKIINYILEFPENSLVFFDDGLASLYNYRDFFKEYTKVKFIIAINPWVVENATEFYKNGKINFDYIECFNAHKKIITRLEFNHYLPIELIQELNSKYNCEIADHSYDHFLIRKKIRNLREKVNYYKELVSKSKKFYEKNKINPTKYVRPYNRENSVYEVLVKKNLGIKDIYGAERISGPWNKKEE